LKYLRNETKCFPSYVMNRLDEIRGNSDTYQWQFISGVSNPADDCTRYVSPSTLSSTKHRWLTGPVFLFENKICDFENNKFFEFQFNFASTGKNEQREISNEMTTTDEVRKDTKRQNLTSDEIRNDMILTSDEMRKDTIRTNDEIRQDTIRTNDEIRQNTIRTNDEIRKEIIQGEPIRNETLRNIHFVIKWDHYSSWLKLRRHIAWILKLKRNWLCNRRKQSRLNFNYLLASDINEAETQIIQIAQIESFPTEMNVLTNNKVLTKSKLLPLKPFVDSRRLLRVGGRLKNAMIPYDKKHQIIVDNKHALARLLTNHVHETNFHAGRNATLSILRERFWILVGKRFVRSELAKCPVCKIARASPAFPLMGDLPSERLAYNEAPFTNCAVDYFGPLIVKLNRGSTRSNAATAKRWVSLFTCMTTRAVHMELVSDMTTDCFLLAFRRFISRRGKPIKIVSDNGTNFVGAAKELFTSQADRNKLLKSMSNLSIEWSFNPPGAPWMGGIFESMVKIAKQCLRTIVTDRLLDEESLRTFLTEIESLMNSRPLTSISDDVNDEEVLTPNHFLVNRFPQTEDLVGDEINTRVKWQKVQAATTKFWELWTKLYLPELTKRSKWFKEKRSLKVSDVVIYVDNTLLRKKWPIGRIVKVFPSADGMIRKVELKTKSGIYVHVYRIIIYVLCSFLRFSVHVFPCYFFRI